MTTLPFFLNTPPPAAAAAGPPLRPPTVHDLIDAYAKEVLPHKAPKTRYQTMRMHLAFETQFGATLLQDITPAFLRAWRDSLSTRYAPGTVRRYLDIFSALLTFAVRELDWLDTHPMRKVRKPPEGKGRSRVLTLEERTRLLAVCQQSHNHYLPDIVLLALHTGMRKEEIRGLTWPYVDVPGACVRLVDTKNGSPRVVPLVGEALTVMQRLAAARHPQIPWVFPRWDGTQPTEFERAWERAVHKAGIADFHFHDLRHMAASYLAMSGASLIEIAAILGHKTMRMVQKYSHLSDAHNSEVLARMAYKFLATEKGPADV